MNQHRTVRLVVLLGLAGAILLSTLLLMPYQSEVYSIDRRTGNRERVVTYWGIYSVRRPMKDMAKYFGRFGNFTAESKSIPCLYITQRFPWSMPEAEGILPGDTYQTVFDELFFALQRWSTSNGEREVPAGEVDAAFRRRIPIWNSDEVERDPQAILTRIRRENDQLHGLPVPTPASGSTP